MTSANRKSPTYSRSRLRHGFAAFACLLLFGMSLDCAAPEATAPPGRVGRSARPMDADPYFAEKLGREALEKIGYLPIINLARQAGWVTTIRRRRPLGGHPPIPSADMAQIATAGEFTEVYSRYAVAAGLTTQFDTPLPGPFDIDAIGILVIGLVDATLLKGALLQTLTDAVKQAADSTTSAPPTPKPEPKPEPEGEQKTTDPPPPIMRPPPERETCGENMPQFIRCDDPRIKYRFSGENVAFSEIVRTVGKDVRKEKSKAAAREGPCVGRGGFHTNVLRGGRYVASIVGCNCCDDGGGKAIKKQRADVLYK